MSLTFRNFVLFGLFTVLVSSLSISSLDHRNQNQHMVKVHESATKFTAHQQSRTNFGQKILSTIDAIAKSVQPNTPSIISTSSLTTFAYDRSTCESLTDDQKKQISDKVKSTKDSITSFKSKVKDNKLLADADNSIQYLDTIQKLTSSTCSNFRTYLLIGPTPYQTNINTNKSWILGGITMDDLVNDYINRITVNNNVTNCGNDTPFWNGFKCIACNNPKPIFNMSSSDCTACPTGKVFDLKTRTCVDSQAPAAKSWKPNPAAEPNALVPADAPKNALSTYMNTGNDLCPADKPFVKDNTCISCPSDKPYFNIIAKECQQCPQNQVFDAATHKCIPGKPIATNVPVYTPRLVMNDNSTSADWDKYVKENDNKVFCPADKPFWTGSQCIQCPDLFNVITRKCVSCDPGLTLHTDTHKCDPADRIEPSLKDLFNAIF